MAWAARATTNCLANPDNLAEWKNRYLVWQLLGAFLSMGFNSKTTFVARLRRVRSAFMAHGNSQ